LASLGTADEDIYEEIKNVLYTDSAVAGEAAGISMAYSWLEQAVIRQMKCLFLHAHETQHEKITR
jgi:26S proteasome regulatory subunit N2